MKPRTIEVGESNQNGDVEALNGALKRRLEQHLLLRGSRDFASEEEYERWVQGIAEKANALRTAKVGEELAAMRPLVVSRLPEYDEETVRVSEWSTIRVKHNTYSVPSRLIGEMGQGARLRGPARGALRRRAAADRGAAARARAGTASTTGTSSGRWCSKPGAFARYRYREELFPTLIFRRAYDALSEAQPGTEGGPRVPADPAPGGHDDGVATSRRRSSCCSMQGSAADAGQVKALVSPRRTDGARSEAAARSTCATTTGCSPAGGGGVMTDAAEHPREPGLLLARAQAAGLRRALRGDGGPRRPRGGLELRAVPAPALLEPRSASDGSAGSSGS